MANVTKLILVTTLAKKYYASPFTVKLIFLFEKYKFFNTPHLTDDVGCGSKLVLEHGIKGAADEEIQ